MNTVEGARGHYSPAAYDRNLYKIVFTRADLRTEQDVKGKELILSTIGRTPVVEVWVDLSKNKVVGIKNPPATAKYENVPVPIY